MPDALPILWRGGGGGGQVHDALRMLSECANNKSGNGGVLNYHDKIILPDGSSTTVREPCCHGGGLSQTQSSLVQSFRRLYFIIENSELTPAPIFSQTKQLNKPSNSRQATKATPIATKTRTTLSFC